MKRPPGPWLDIDMVNLCETLAVAPSVLRRERASDLAQILAVQRARQTAAARLRARAEAEAEMNQRRA